MPIANTLTAIRSVKYITNGLKTLANRKIEVPVLDGTAIGVSVFRGDFQTAGSIMFLLGIGEILEEWTHKKSVGDLARSMSLNIGRVWLKKDGQEVQVSAESIHVDDEIVIHVGNVIPFDGTVVDGDAMVNQASMTGEPLPVHKQADSYVYAGTVLEEGELCIRVRQVGGSSRYEKVVTMIEESEKLKSSLESKASHLADKLVPYTLLGTAATYLFTRNVTASKSSITVKGGKFLEAMAEADTIVFDKTGTLTKAAPRVVDVVSFCDENSDELLRIAACLEEHFPHSMARAVVDAASEKNLVHEEVHSKVSYIVAHGISTTVEGRKTIIGSYHFVFEDEGCVVPEGMQEKFDALPEEYSHLYMAVEGRLVAVICIEDPIRDEAADVIRTLKELGFAKVVMMTGDSERTACAIARKVGVDEYYSEVLPEDKASYVERAKAEGHKVIMIGDGINDSPALSAADIGIAISDGAEIAREIADITVGADNLNELITLRKISTALTRRIRRNYRTIVGFNTGLIVLGVAGVIQPTTSALMHNTSTLAIGLHSMKDLVL